VIGKFDGTTFHERSSGRSVLWAIGQGFYATNTWNDSPSPVAGWIGWFATGSMRTSSDVIWAEPNLPAHADATPLCRWAPSGPATVRELESCGGRNPHRKRYVNDVTEDRETRTNGEVYEFEAEFAPGQATILDSLRRSRMLNLGRF